MNYAYRKCTVKEIQPLVDAYIKTLSSSFDSYLEDHIAASDFYTIDDNATVIGYFSFNEDSFITQFYLKKEYLKDSQKIFIDILEHYQIKHALVFSGDELFLSLVMDQEVILKKQAYFFQDSGADIDVNSLYQGGGFRQAIRDDIPLLLQETGDFFDSLEERVDRGEIFVFMGEELLGAGIIEYGKILSGHISIGMFTNEKYRRKGIGRTIIIKLKQWCYDKGYTPICGCWYYNHDSKKTLESAGMITKTRLFNVEFIKGIGNKL